jgi:hypothetical protein
MKSKRWLRNRGLRDGVSCGCGDFLFRNEPHYLHGLAEGMHRQQEKFRATLSEKDRTIYDHGLEDGKFGHQPRQTTGVYFEGYVAGYLAWVCFVNDTEDHVRTRAECPNGDCGGVNAARAEEFVPLLTLMADFDRREQGVPLRQPGAHIPHAYKDLSDLDRSTRFEESHQRPD